MMGVSGINLSDLATFSKDATLGEAHGLGTGTASSIKLAALLGGD